MSINKTFNMQCNHTGYISNTYHNRNRRVLSTTGYATGNPSENALGVGTGFVGTADASETGTVICVVPVDSPFGSVMTGVGVGVAVDDVEYGSLRVVDMAGISSGRILPLHTHTPKSTNSSIK